MVKKIDKKPPGKMVSVRMSPALYDAIKREAERDRRSIAAVIKLALEDRFPAARKGK